VALALNGPAGWSGDLPNSSDGYEIKLPDGFQAPQGLTFEFDITILLSKKRGSSLTSVIDQEMFSKMVGVYASTQMGSAIPNLQLREMDMRGLGSGPPPQNQIRQQTLRTPVS
jgi:hypothetical protein